jgi:mono/diheme cytochrome c family protein
MTSQTSNLYAHAAFVTVAALLSLQSACSRSADATPKAAAPTTVAPSEHIVAKNAVDAGRYLVKVAGCNDCHTPGYVEGVMMTGKAMPESDWLKGGDVGYSGPWGVSYPSNLRLALDNMSEEQFVELSRNGQGRPPMPWPSLQAMSDEDLKAIYAYIRSLGPAGKPAPAALSPGVAPDRPHIVFAPQMPAKG